MRSRIARTRKTDPVSKEEISQTSNNNKKHGWGLWRVGMLTKNTGYCSNGPGFDFQHLHGSPQLSVIPVLGDPITFSGLSGYQIHMQGKITYTLKKLIKI